MKYLKKFENLIVPKIGDYILTKLPIDDVDEITMIINKFLNENIGKIVGINRHPVEYSYYVQYDNIPKDLFTNFNYTKHREDVIQYENYRIINLRYILHFSDKLFDINILKNANKFNL